MLWDDKQRPKYVSAWMFMSRSMRPSLYFSTKDLSGKLTNSKWTSSKRKDPNDPPPNKRPESPLHGELSNAKETETRVPPRTSVLERRDETRRIVVKRSGADATSLPSDPIELRQRIGLINRRFPLEHEITDSGGKTIWIPAKQIVDADHRILATQFPQIQAAAWLDPATYCRGGGQSIAGTVAARQLLRGKKDLMEVLGYAVYSSSSAATAYNKMNRRSIVLQGHGLPPQILQHHIDYAAALLERLQASEVSFKQFNIAQHHNSLASTEAVRGIRSCHVRDAATGANRVDPWPMDDPVPEPDPWQDDLQLYWTVMDRIATRLGLAVLLKRPQVMTATDALHRRPRSDYSLLSGITTNSMLHTPPHHWKVKFSREFHFLPQVLPTSSSSSNRYSGLHPVLEWTPLEGVAAPGHVCIRLQGLSGDTPVSLSFDAGFRTHVIPSTSTSSTD